MSRKKFTVKLEETISPNLIPMIDIMFLLLLFLMLGADMGQRELEEVQLPKAKSVKTDKNIVEARAVQRLTINIYHKYDQDVKCKIHDAYANGKQGAVCRNINHWLVGIKGKNFTYYDQDKSREEEKKKTLIAFVQREARLFPDTEVKPGEQFRSTRKTQIRADGSAPYSLVQDAMMIAVTSGIFKIEFGAAQIMKK